MIRLFAICKNPYLFDSFKPTLQANDIEIVQVCNDPEKAVEVYKQISVDIVITDFNWIYHKVTGPQLVQALLEFDKDARIIGFTTHFDQKVCERLKDCGAKGYFPKNESLYIIIECISVVCLGKTFYYIQEPTK